VIQYQRATPDDPLYAQAEALREAVLLRPLGKDIAWFREHYPHVHERAECFVALIDHPAGPRVVGCVLLIPDHPEDGVGKLMQMAVDPQRQGEGIGRRLVIELETRAFGELGLTEVFCHAQNAAVGFYARLGWETDPEEFQEAGIPHHRMWIRQTADQPEGEPIPDE
jgi:N-acetylglutamate synthase-like GNAT family acetyltransferase